MDNLDLEKMGKWMSEELGDTPHEQVIEERRAFLSSVESNRRTVRPTVMAFAAVAAVLTLAFVVGFGLLESSESSPRSPVAAEQVEGHQVIAQDTGSEVIRFDGGSEFVLDSGSIAKVVSSSASEVVLDLQEGGVGCSVNGNGHTRWLVRAGEYQVLVTGTEFRVRWQPEVPFFEVIVSEGSVNVTGDALNANGIVLAAGENISVDGSQVLISRDESEDNAHEDKQKTKRRRGLPNRNPLQNAADEKEPSFEELLQTLSYGELWKRSKTARYAGQHGEAYQLLTTIRNRFPGQPYANQATFLLGRISLESRKNPFQAKKWFEAYLRSLPTGPLAEESLGRLIGICQSTGGSCAKRHATQYLAKYPHGMFAELAQSVIE